MANGCATTTRRRGRAVDARRARIVFSRARCVGGLRAVFARALAIVALEGSDRSGRVSIGSIARPRGGCDTDEGVDSFLSPSVFGHLVYIKDSVCRTMLFFSVFLQMRTKSFWMILEDFVFAFV